MFEVFFLKFSEQFYFMGVVVHCCRFIHSSSQAINAIICIQTSSTLSAINANICPLFRLVSQDSLFYFIKNFITVTSQLTHLFLWRLMFAWLVPEFCWFTSAVLPFTAWQHCLQRFMNSLSYPSFCLHLYVWHNTELIMMLLMQWYMRRKKQQRTTQEEVRPATTQMLIKFENSMWMCYFHYKSSIRESLIGALISVWKQYCWVHCYSYLYISQIWCVLVWGHIKIQMLFLLFTFIIFWMKPSFS